MKKEINKNSPFNPNAYNVLKERGFIHSASHEAEMKAALEKGPLTFYLGIDPTADNLHIGHCFPLLVFKILQDHGHNGILLLGTATATIGDPSFKNEMRKPMTQEQTHANANKILDKVGRFIDLDKTKIVYNGDWFDKINVMDFMGSIGTHFNISEMLAKDIYKNRLGAGLTMLELFYMSMQAYDAIHLNNEFGCTLQLGGSDQWANILAGSELGRKMSLANGKPRTTLFAMCNPLLLTADGKKMGKTEKGALWVTGGENLAYECFQYFYNQDDSYIEKCLLYYSDMPVAEIKSICKSDILVAKELMAFEVTKRVHGRTAAIKAKETSKQLFQSGNTCPADLPTETIKADKGANIVDILALTSIVKSKREAREFIAAGAILIDNEKITDTNFVPTKTDFLVKKGKKTFLKIVLC